MLQQVGAADRLRGSIVYESSVLSYEDGKVESLGDLNPKGPSPQGPLQGANNAVRTGGLCMGLFIKGKLILC